MIGLMLMGLVGVVVVMVLAPVVMVQLMSETLAERRGMSVASPAGVGPRDSVRTTDEAPLSSRLRELVTELEEAPLSSRLSTLAV